MEPPPVQYVRTPDGFDIAYTVCGEGLPFVMMPWPFSHRGRWWQSAFGRPLSAALAERFRLIQYDSRGQGMSTRGLPEDHSIHDYVTDLEAVVDNLGLPRFVLYGAPLTGHVAVRYAVKHPERVEALVIADTNIRSAYGGGALEESVRRDWDAFLHITVSSFSLPGAPRELSYWRDSISQDDWLRMSQAGRASHIGDLLPQIRVPTLVLSPRMLGPEAPANAMVEDGQAMAATIPNARLIVYDGGFAGVLYSQAPEPPPFVTYVEDFLKDIRKRETEPPEGPLPASLSSREVQVLRLLAAGKTNREIAEALVISEHTVIRHVSNIFTKTGAENRAAAAAFGLRHGLV